MHQGETERTRKIGEQILRELADVIRREMKDPRATWITLHAVQVSRDLSRARVYFSTLNDSDRDAISSLLGKASGFLRYELGKRIKIRVIPALHFYYDDSIAEGNRLASLIEEAVESDKAKQEGRSGTE